MRRKLYGKVESNLGADTAKWLVIEEDPDETGGVFLYIHDSLEEPCNFDEWYESTSEAKNAASRRWKIVDEWKQTPF